MITKDEGHPQAVHHLPAPEVAEVHALWPGEGPPPLPTLVSPVPPPERCVHASRRCACTDFMRTAHGVHSCALTRGAHFCAPVHDDRTVQPSGKSQKSKLLLSRHAGETSQPAAQPRARLAEQIKTLYNSS